MIKVYIKKTLSFFKLLYLFEKINFLKQKFVNRKKNRKFLVENPSIKMPPNYFMYETFNLDYHKIYFGGEETANWLINHFKKYIDFNNKSILDWGCGSGRVLRHLPKIIGASNKVYGTDYNSKYSKWCNENIQNVIVKENRLTPPLNYKDGFFDALYGISIFTHLSEQNHHLWFKELNRVLKKDGIILISTHGRFFKGKLTNHEQSLFDEGKLVEHTYKVEGNRLFVAYQPSEFMQFLSELYGFKILDHIEEGIRNKKPQQDVWILQKK